MDAPAACLDTAPTSEVTGDWLAVERAYVQLSQRLEMNTLTATLNLAAL
jgi:hypothetical protein